MCVTLRETLGMPQVVVGVSPFEVIFTLMGRIRQPVVVHAIGYYWSPDARFVHGMGLGIYTANVIVARLPLVCHVWLRIARLIVQYSKTLHSMNNVTYAWISWGAGSWVSTFCPNFSTHF